MDMQLSHTRLFPSLGSSMLSPPNVFAPKVGGTQSGTTYYHPEQDIIETHSHCSLATDDISHFVSAWNRILDGIAYTKNDGAFVEDYSRRECVGSPSLSMAGIG
jgi:hypothetical protein